MTCQLKIVGWLIATVWCLSLLVMNISFTLAAETYPTSNYTLEEKRLFIHNLMYEPYMAAQWWGEAACSPPANASKAENPRNYSVVGCPDFGGFLIGSAHSTLNALPAMWVMKRRDVELELFRTRILKGTFDWRSPHDPDQDIRRGWKWVWLNSLVTDVLGPLLSLYALTSDEAYLEKALNLSERVLEPSFKHTPVDGPFPVQENEQKLPSKLVELYDRCEAVSQTPLNQSSDCWNYCNIHECPNLRRDDRPDRLPETDRWSISELGSMQLELNYLAVVSIKPIWRERVNAIRERVEEMTKANGHDMPYDFVSVRSQTMWGDASLYEGQLHYYTGLIKSFIASKGTDKEALRLYNKALDQAERWGLFQKVPNDKPGNKFSNNEHWYHRSKYEADTNQVSGTVRSTGASLGAMLALGANAAETLVPFSPGLSNSTWLEDRFRSARHWQLARGLTETYQAATEASKGLLPHVFSFEPQWGKMKVHQTKYRPEHNHLSPDLAESLFVLWRLTKEQKYRDYAWRLAEALNYRCREFARKGDRLYRGTCLDDVGNGQEPVHWMNDPFSIHYSATLLYLHLTFADDDVLPLDKWVFTSKGYPLPICGWQLSNIGCGQRSKDKPKV